MKLLLVIFFGFSVGVVFDKYNVNDKIQKTVNKTTKSLKSYTKTKKKESSNKLNEFKESKDFSTYLDKVNSKAPKTSFYKKNGSCYTIQEHERIFKLGTYKVFTKVNCP